jgi:hypothetical protein
MTETFDEVDQFAARLDSMMTRLEVVIANQERINALLSEYEPIIRAYLDPAASGPVAWAVRRKMR